MYTPKLPSFFKSYQAKKFNFIPRYYDAKKERKEELLNSKIKSIKFRRKSLPKNMKNERRYKIIFLIIILSLLSYKLII
tara:strand:- start:1016 stop:1252 length:237 start_codon:yes stop_codon:yes gene_type:complete